MPYVMFVNIERERQGLEEANVQAVLVLLFFSLVGDFQLGHDSVCYSFAGKEITREISLILELIKKRNFTLDGAIYQHRSILQRCSPHIQAASMEISGFFVVILLASFTEIYDFFVMSWSHWFHMADFFMKSVFTIIFINRQWAPINYLNNELQFHVAKAVAGAEGGELWTVQERSYFLQYLSIVKPKSCVFFFGKEAGMKFAAEVMALDLTLFFVVYQMTSMDGWTGFSLDQKWIYNTTGGTEF